MTISVVCPQCGKSYDVPDSRAGQTGKCACGANIPIPSPVKNPLPFANTSQKPTTDPTPIAPWESSSRSAQSVPRYDPRNPHAPPVRSSYDPRTGEYRSPSNKRPYERSDTMYQPWIPDELTRPVVLAVMIVIADIFFGYALYSAVLSIINLAPVLEEMPGEFRDPYLIGVIAGIVICAAIIFVGYSLWNGYKWARITMIVLMSIVAAGSMNAITGPMQQYVGIYLLVLLLSVLFITILCMKSSKDYCIF